MDDQTSYIDDLTLGQRVLYGFAIWLGLIVIVINIWSMLEMALLIGAGLAIMWYFADDVLKDRLRSKGADRQPVKEWMRFAWQLMREFPFAGISLAKHVLAACMHRPSNGQKLFVPEDFKAPAHPPALPPAPSLAPAPIVELPPAAQAPQVPAKKTAKNPKPRPSPAASSKQKKVPSPALETSQPEDPNPWAPAQPSQVGRRVGYNADGSPYVY